LGNCSLPPPTFSPNPGYVGFAALSDTSIGSAFNMTVGYDFQEYGAMKNAYRIVSLAGIDRLAAAGFFLVVVQACSGHAVAGTDASMGGAVNSGGSSGTDASMGGAVNSGGSSVSNAGATGGSPNLEAKKCPAQRSALLAALAADSEPCATDDDCERYLAWSLPNDSRDCDGGWPIANLDSHKADLNAKVQAVADCINKAGGEIVATCGIDYGPHSTHCQTGQCELNPPTL
jgi:hypothetical protein